MKNNKDAYGETKHAIVLDRSFMFLKSNSKFISKQNHPFIVKHFYFSEKPH